MIKFLPLILISLLAVVACDSDRTMRAKGAVTTDPGPNPEPLPPEPPPSNPDLAMAPTFADGDGSDGADYLYTAEPRDIAVARFLRSAADPFPHVLAASLRRLAPAVDGNSTPFVEMEVHLSDRDEPLLFDGLAGERLSRKGLPAGAPEDDELIVKSYCESECFSVVVTLSQNAEDRISAGAVMVFNRLTHEAEIAVRADDNKRVRWQFLPSEPIQIQLSPPEAAQPVEAQP